MRVTFEAQYRHAADALERANEQKLLYQRQVMSGKRVQRPSHDPLAAAAASIERGRLAATDQYSATSDSARARLTVADNVLSSIVEQLTAAQSTVLSARGSVLTQAQRDIKAQELEALRDSVYQLLNTPFRGTYLFAGARSTTQPYTQNGAGVVSAYQGSTLEVQVDVDRNVAVTTGFNGEALAKGSEVDDLFVVFDRAATAARNGDSAALATAAADLQRALDRATITQSRVGESLRAVEEADLRLGEAARVSQEQLSALEDANMAAAITSLTQAETVYRAALAASAQLQRLSLMDYMR